MGRARLDDQSRSNFCVLGPDDLDCGSAWAYQREACSDGPCRKAWRTYCDRLKTREKTQKVYLNEHGTIACYLEGCTCEWCEKAMRWYQAIQDAEDIVLANVPGCVTWQRLRREHARRSKTNRNVFRGHGERARYRQGCRCRLCKLANTIHRASQRESATLPRLNREWLCLRARLNQEVNKILASWPWARFTVEDYESLPEHCTARNAAESAAAKDGLTRYVPYAAPSPRRHVIDLANRWDRAKRETISAEIT